MSVKYFLDTNILIYSFDHSSKNKQTIAQNLIQKALTDNAGVISWQVAQEFLNASTRLFKKIFTPQDIHEESMLSLVEIPQDSP